MMIRAIAAALTAAVLAAGPAAADTTTYPDRVTSVVYGNNKTGWVVFTNGGLSGTYPPRRDAMGACDTWVCRVVTARLYRMLRNTRDARL